MNTEILSRMSLDGLNKLKAALDAELAARLDTSVRVGRTGWFDTRTRLPSGEMDRRHVRIERINPKTLSCVELEDSYRPGTRWKVGPSLLKIDPVPRSTAEARRAAPISSRPATTAPSAWA